MLPLVLATPLLYFLQKMRVVYFMVRKVHVSEKVP